MGYKQEALALIDILRSAVANCMQGDKVAVQLSGGLDSAIVQAIAKCENLYCITWPEEDNLTTAKLAASGREVEGVTFTYEEMLETLPEIAKLTDGKGTWTQAAQWFCGRAMAADGVTVVLNGEGADELFWGYPRYKVLRRLDANYSDPKLAAYQDATAYKIHGSPVDAVAALLSRNMSRVQAQELAESANYDRGCAGAAADVEERVGLVELLHFEEVIAAAHGIEHRWPFMDPRVIEFAHSLDADALINENHCKAILRRVAAMLGVHCDIVNETTKKGLFIPQSWRPKGEPKWSRRWFAELMRGAANGAA